MDNQNTFAIAETADDDGVLILVLMDNQNTSLGRWMYEVLGVLILVLMDNQNTFYLIVVSRPPKCLNPCSNG